MAKVTFTRNPDSSLTSSNGFDFSVNDVKDAHIAEALESLYEQNGSTTASTLEEFHKDFNEWLSDTDGLVCGIFNASGECVGVIIFIDAISIHHGSGVGVYLTVIKEYQHDLQINKALCGALHYLLNEVGMIGNYFVRFKHISSKVVNEIYSFKKRKES